MQDLVGLLIAFVLGFFAKHLLETVCQSRLVEGKYSGLVNRGSGNGISKIFKWGEGILS